MRIELITEENERKYLQLLTGDEIMGMQTGRISCIGAFDEEQYQAMGLIALQILPRHITIHRMLTLPDYRKQGVAMALLERATALPPEEKMTFYVITEDAASDVGFLENRGFTKARSKYYYRTGKLSDLRGTPEAGVKVVTAGKVSFPSLADYIAGGKPDSFVQMPEVFPDMQRFSELSLCCLKDTSLCGTVMLEELSGGLQISFFHAENEKILNTMFYATKRFLEAEYGPDTALRFLICNETERAAAEKYLPGGTEQPVMIYKRKTTG